MQVPGNRGRLHDFPREARAYPFGEPPQPTAGCEPAGFLEYRMTCPNTHCTAGRERVVVCTEGHIALAVRQAVNPRRPLKLLPMFAPCRFCKPDERAVWDAQLAVPPRRPLSRSAP